MSVTTAQGDAPATVTIDRIANILRSGHFGPALIQRQFEWTRTEAHRLLDNLERAYQRGRTDEEGETQTGAADGEIIHEGLVPDDEADGAGNIDARSLSDVDLDVARADVAPIVDIDCTTPPMKDFFLGNIIMRQAGAHQHEIYDGLQRFTTLTILIAVLRDQIKDTALKRELNQYINAENGVRLSLFGRDRTLANHVQEPGGTLRTHKSVAHYEIGRRILYVKNAMRFRIEGWKRTRRESFARFLLSSVWVGVLTVPDQRMAQEMFVNTNLYGKPLDVIDVLKGQLVDLVSQSLGDKDVAQFTRYWTATRDEGGETFTEMLKAFDAIERREIQGQSWPTDLGAHVASYYSAENIKRFQGRLWSHMKGWQTCRRIMSRPGASQLERDLWRLSVFWWPEWHPLALKWWLEVHFARKDESEWNEKKGLFASRFRRLHRRCMAITLARFSETDRQKIFRNALDQDSRGIDVFANALSLSIDQRRKVDRTLVGQIHERDVWAPLTRWLEMSRWDDELPRLIASANAEHVRPRSMNWEEDDADDAQAYNEGCFSLGNLALVSKRANKKMLNASFTDKMPVLLEEAEKFWTLRSVVEDRDGKQRTEWGNDVILERAEVLRSEVWKLLLLRQPAP